MPAVIPDVQTGRVAETMQVRQPRRLDEDPAGSAERPRQWAPARDDTPALRPPGLSSLPGPIEDVLIRRRSVRSFAPDPVPASFVRDAVTAARDAEAATWPAGPHGLVTFTVLVAAYRVSGTARGLYAPGAEAGARPLRSAGACLDALPALYTDAPVLLLICADLNEACRTAGASGYPSALVRAGTMGYAAWLWALSAGLAGSVYAPASHQVTAVARQLDVNLRHLFTVALGAPARPAGSRGDAEAADRGAR
jgi:nitroreductase